MSPTKVLELIDVHSSYSEINVLKGINLEIGMGEIIALLGKGGGELKKIANQSIIINSNKTGSIQETHKIIFHSICETFENI